MNSNTTTIATAGSAGMVAFALVSFVQPILVNHNMPLTVEQANAAIALLTFGFHYLAALKILPALPVGDIAVLGLTPANPALVSSPAPVSPAPALQPVHASASATAQNPAPIYQNS